MRSAAFTILSISAAAGKGTRTAPCLWKQPIVTTHIKTGFAQWKFAPGSEVIRGQAKKNGRCDRNFVQAAGPGMAATRTGCPGPRACPDAFGTHRLVRHFYPSHSSSRWEYNRGRRPRFHCESRLL